MTKEEHYRDLLVQIHRIVTGRATITLSEAGYDGLPALVDEFVSRAYPGRERKPGFDR